MGQASTKHQQQTKNDQEEPNKINDTEQQQQTTSKQQTTSEEQSTSEEQQSGKQPHRHSSIFNSIKRTHKRRPLSGTKSLKRPSRTSSWNPFRSLSNRSSTTRKRPHLTHFDTSEHRSNTTPPSSTTNQSNLSSNFIPPEEIANTTPSHPSLVISAPQETSQSEPTHPTSHSSTPIPPDTAPANHSSEQEQSQSQSVEPTSLPETESTSVDGPPAGIRAPARRIYVQGMVVVRNVNETPIQTVPPADLISPHVESSNPNPSAQSADVPQPSDAQPISSDPIDFTRNPSTHAHNEPTGTSSSNQLPQPSPPPSATHPTHHSNSADSATALPSQHPIAPSQVQIEQATMISRLLSAAAAATASSLLPYAIHADGTSIQNPSNQHNADEPHPHSRPRSTSHPTEMTSSSTHIRSASSAGHHPHHNQDTSNNDRDSHTGLQTTLRDALRAAFGGALVNPSTEASPVESPRSSASSPPASADHQLPTLPAPALPSSEPVSPLLSPQAPNGVPIEPVAPRDAPTSSAPSARRTGSVSRIIQRLGLANHRHDHSSGQSSPASSASIPQILSDEASSTPSSAEPRSTQAEEPLGANDANPSNPGDFERFLRDLQADVGAAILVALGARQPAVVDQEELDERVRLASVLPFADDDDDDDDEEEEEEQNEADRSGDRDSVAGGPVGPSFNFFRMHRFEGIHPPDQAGRGNASAGTGANDAANVTLIPVLLVGVRSAPPNPLLGALERIASHAPAPEAARPQDQHTHGAEPPPNVSVNPPGDHNLDDDQFRSDRDDVQYARSGSEGRRSLESQEEGSIGLRRIFQDQSEESFDAWTEDVGPASASNPLVDAQDIPPNDPSRPVIRADVATPGPAPRSWLIFVLAANVYVVVCIGSHPIFTAPSLFIPHGLQSTHSTGVAEPTEEDVDESEEAGENRPLRRVTSADGSSGAGLVRRLRGQRDDRQPSSRPDQIEEQLLDYEAMIRLAELIGQTTNNPLLGFAGKPPVDTLTQQQIDESDKFKNSCPDASNQQSCDDQPIMSDDGNNVGGSEQRNSCLRKHSREVSHRRKKRLTCFSHVVCLDEYEAEEQCHPFPCSPTILSFRLLIYTPSCSACRPCVDQWLVKCAASCPVCRQKAVH
ncbi:hypothetical protein VP01_1895g1 [Puccinia sorghi]|uniref:Uncharacterized protein n=1 Tax=Puccinia sorghi TaxID=27349 RepID=A0A0L6VDH2_9BASI|nr:hypothetical protein VP01_1895g1 [Puccinia sorghi]